MPNITTNHAITYTNSRKILAWKILEFIEQFLAFLNLIFKLFITLVF